MPFPAKHLTTIDTMKGISIIVLFYGHSAFIWRTTDWFAFMRFTWLVSDFIGPIMFITMSVLANMISAANETIGNQRDSRTRRAWIRASFLFLMGVIYDLGSIVRMGAYFIIGANIFYTIAIFSLLNPLIMRLKVRTRVALIAIIMILYYPLLDLSLKSITAAGLDADVFIPTQLMDIPTFFYYILFNQGQTVPFFPWILVPLVASIIFEPFITNQGTATPETLHAGFTRIRNAGLIFITAAIALGFWLFPGYGFDIMSDMNVPGSFFTWPYPEGVPVFLVRYTLQYIFYNLGIVFVLFGVLGEWQLVRGKHVLWEKKVNNFGRLSITGFIMSHVAYLFWWARMPILLFLVIYGIMMIALVNGFWFWSEKYDAIGSPEWILKAYIKRATKLLEKRDQKKKNLNAGALDGFKP
jgi:hypothetical protein